MIVVWSPDVPPPELGVEGLEGVDGLLLLLLPLLPLPLLLEEELLLEEGAFEGNWSPELIGGFQLGELYPDEGVPIVGFARWVQEAVNMHMIQIDVKIVRIILNI